MSNYKIIPLCSNNIISLSSHYLLKIINLEPIKISHFINIENGSKLISLSIQTGNKFEDVTLTPNQAVLIANELLERAKLINAD